MGEMTVEGLLGTLQDRVVSLTIQCNVMTNEGRQHVATFLYFHAGADHTAVVQGTNMLEVLRKVEHFMNEIQGVTEQYCTCATGPYRGEHDKDCPQSNR